MLLLSLELMGKELLERRVPPRMQLATVTGSKRNKDKN